MFQDIQLYITRRARPNHSGSNRWNLCFKKKLRFYNEIRLTLKPGKLGNHQTNETTLNANRLITVT